MEDLSSSQDLDVPDEDWSSANQLAPQDLENLMGMLECAICVDFVNEPTELLCCHQLCCANCVNSWLVSKRTCPLCRANSPQTAVNVIIKRFIDGLSAECRNAGCEVRVPRVDLPAHERQCDFRPENVERRTREKSAALAAQKAAMEQKMRNGTATAAECLIQSAELLKAQDFAGSLSFAERAKQLGGGADAEEAVGDVLFAQGQWERALTSFRTGKKLAKIAETQIKLGRFADAESTLQELFSTGAGSADVVTLLRLAELKKKTNAYSEALTLLRQAERLLNNDKSALWIDLKLAEADVARKTERYEDSKRIYITVLKRAEKLLGRKSQAVAACLNALGILSKKLGIYNDAIRYLKAAIRVKVHLNGGSHQHPQIAEFLTNLADVYRKKSEFAPAEALYRRAMGIFEQLGNVESNIEAAEALNGLGLIAKKYSRYDDAAACYDRALAICRTVFKEKLNYKMGIFGNNRAEIERKRGNYDQAIKMYAEALKIISSTLGPQHSEAADPLHGMGLCYHQLGQFDEALKNILSAIKIVEREFGASHYKVGVFKSSSGLARAMLNDFEGAYADLKLSLHVLIQSLGEGHVEVADVLAALGDVCIKIFVESRGSQPEKLEEGKKYYVRAREICVQKLGENHTKVQQMDSLIFIADNYNALM